MVLMLAPWKKTYDQPKQHIKMQRHYFANKGTSSQSYGFSSSHVWMWELDYKESWMLKNWCFWAMVLEKTLESPLDCKEIKPVILKEYSLEGLMLKLKLQYFGYLMQRTDLLERLWCWERLKAGEEGDDRDEMVGWDHQIDWWWRGKPGVLQSMWDSMFTKRWTWLSDWTEWYWCRIAYLPYS